MDNASYHSKIINKAPTHNNRKSEIVDWLSRNNIEHESSFSKSELIDLCKKYKEKQKYVIDDIAAAHSHKILRLPPYHCEFNPIELIWAKVKTEVKKNKLK